ncbi:MAG: TVP38/TMEM64 family protein [Proteobacteria bacterium]|nr:TVP38/TMEM64 family protein [Pseudomonadota bacterium]MBU1061034.1 TVP38/TMEM64 family protein [Pseudomonadota bacterium]
MNKNLINKLAIVVAGAVLVALFFGLDLQQYLTLEYLKESQARFADLYDEKPAMVIGSYMAIYILVTALSLPGAAILTLAGGALFGLVTGLVVVSFASSIGATLACFVARFVLRDWVQNKFGDRLTTINEGIAREGAFYLFTLRLIPVFPFFVINLVMGLTQMSLFTFYWVSQLGMLAGTIVFVNAGKEIGKIDSLSGIFSPGLIGSFVLLGLFPLAVKKLVTSIQGRKK